MTDPLDDALRDALRAEAGDATADDDLLRRIQTQVATAPARRRRALVLVAASVVAILGVGTALLVDGGDDHEGLDVVDVPDGSSTSSTAPAPEPGTPRPDLVVLVREDGWLITVDLESGNERELVTAGNPNDEPTIVEEGGPEYIDTVELAGDWVYYSTCCEPASGVIFRIPVGGGDAEHVGYGAHPRVSPDGRFVATTVADGQVWIFDADSNDDVNPIAIFDPAGDQQGFSQPHDLSWTADGTGLSFVESVSNDGRGILHELRWDGTTLTPASAGEPTYISYVTRDPDGSLRPWGNETGSFRSVSQDRSGHWLLWNDPDLGLQVQEGPLATREPLPDVPKALAADW